MTQTPPRNDSPRARVQRKLREWIAEGRYRSDPLPSERSLAEHFGVGRGTVRSALRQLQTEGLLDLSGYRRTVTLPSRGGGLMARTVALATNYHCLVADPATPSGSLRQISISALHRLAEGGYHALTIPIDSLDAQTIEDLVQAPPAALIASDEVVTSGRGLPLLERLLGHGVPCVTFDECERLPGGVDRVLSDHAAGAQMLCEALFARGHRRILRVWSRDKRELPWVRARDRGYDQAHRAAGLPGLPPAVVEGLDQHPADQADFERQSRQLVAQLIEHLLGPDAVDALMLMSDASLPQANRVRTLCQRQAGPELAIVGYDNFFATAAAACFEATPPLATVDKRNDRLGRALAELAIERIEGRAPLAPRSLTLGVELVLPEG